MLDLKDIAHLYSRGTLYNTCHARPKTRVEMRIIEASAMIRSAPEWSEQLRDNSKRQEWTDKLKATYKLTDKNIESVFDVLEYYAQLKAKGRNGEELADMPFGSPEAALAFTNKSTPEAVVDVDHIEILAKKARWLPTDFIVNDNGTVSICSYINNLDPTRYAALYRTISKVFANFVPLVEQVTTEVIHSCKPPA
ncbi:hypothetical protein IWW38_003542, partial [Coemansia aciculifera]